MNFVSFISYLSDIRAKAKRWDQKHVDALKRRRDKYVSEMKDLQKEKRREADLSAMKSQIDGLETRLKFAKKDKETTVCSKNFKYLSNIFLYPHIFKAFDSLTQFFTFPGLNPFFHCLFSIAFIVYY